MTFGEWYRKGVQISGKPVIWGHRVLMEKTKVLYDFKGKGGKKQAVK